MFTSMILLAIFLIQLLFVGRALLRKRREPASRMAWAIVILAVPIVGVGAYLLFGETYINRKRFRRMRDVQQVIGTLPKPSTLAGTFERDVSGLPSRYAAMFRLGEKVNGFRPIGGNTGHLTKDSNDTIESLIADLDAAKHHVHVSFYIWLSDNSGLALIEALKRAVARGVSCRAMTDNLGSHALIKSRHWKVMRESGVDTAVSLPIGPAIMGPLNGRIDLRNHRKIVVIDDWITYCGSQNCADPEFRVKPKYAPWVDAVMRFEGPVARQNQFIFLSDWMTYTDEDLSAMLRRPLPFKASGRSVPGIIAQVLASGPETATFSPSQIFEALIYTAREKLTITTPYYVPNESLQAALCAAARRGVHTEIIFPSRNDSFVVAAASRSYYLELLEAGVRIYEYRDGLLHTKSITVDGAMTLIGSANMDRRSFDLNYESNVLLYDAELTRDMEARQQVYLDSSDLVELSDVEGWSTGQRLWNNTIAMLGPLL
ncbi:cardiolipin synthase [Biformimicrobium ophioploci]|uniref:Cardiolipin synthase n=1 Tax=Biformimicrobium ophioploci TaxID=3036711 RepID=A0ABQ6M1K1_9GAMM|nr:cardiolipin synthase [Microbulbifer sp. NKW57]GMG88228.1 cardiolipin synthase [Microbulbifer sp. NKW57]